MNPKTEKNPRCAGREPTGIKRVTLCISGKPEQIEKLKDLAKDSKNVSQFIFEKTGVLNMAEKKNWFVANDDGEIIGHDMSETSAKLLAQEMQEKEPDAGWESLCGDE